MSLDLLALPLVAWAIWMVARHLRAALISKSTAQRPCSACPTCKLPAVVKSPPNQAQ